uniref:Uncharacterized protein n=1 Tax=Plectus sambesii TaxID=2011161 RepID=A0A914W2C0_9BILA
MDRRGSVKEEEREGRDSRSTEGPMIKVRERAVGSTAPLHLRPGTLLVYHQCTAERLISGGASERPNECCNRAERRQRGGDKRRRQLLLSGSISANHSTSTSLPRALVSRREGRRAPLHIIMSSWSSKCSFVSGANVTSGVRHRRSGLLHAPYQSPRATNSKVSL